jgi:hypothetical protein
MIRYNTTQSTPKFSTENMDRYSAIPNTAETRVPTSNVTDIMNILNNKKRY